MKTKILIITFLLLGLFSVAQVSYLPPAYVPNATTAKLNLGIPVNTIVFVGSLHVPYICIKEIGGNMMTMAQAIAGGYLTTYPYTVVDSTYLHSTGAEKAYGSYTFYNPLNIFFGAYGSYATLIATTALTAKLLTVGSATDTLNRIYMWSSDGKKWGSHMSLSGSVYWATVTP